MCRNSITCRLRNRGREGVSIDEDGSSHKFPEVDVSDCYMICSFKMVRVQTEVPLYTVSLPTVYSTLYMCSCHTTDASVKSDREVSKVSSIPLLIMKPSAINMSSGVVTWQHTRHCITFPCVNWSTGYQGLP